jgi:hypothetical protein
MTERTAMTRLTLAILLVVGGVTAGILLINWPFVERAIALEDAPIAWLQTTAIAASAVACLCHGLLDDRRRTGWFLVALALFAMALDERFMGHERLKEWIWAEVFDGDRVRMGVWGDMPIAAYGVGGAAVVSWIVRGATNRYAATLLWSAIAAGAAALILDIAANSLWIQVWEELLELLAETLFLIALLALLTCIPRIRANTAASSVR